MTACTKEKPLVTEYVSDVITNRSVINCPLVKSAVLKSDGMLVFSSQQHFEDCIECLEEEIEAYNEAYESLHPFASAETLDSLDELNGFNENQPLVDFEQAKSFSSLRALVELQSQNWLDNQSGETINFDYDPDELCPIVDDATRTLFNSTGSVKIGTSIVTMAEWQDDPSAVIVDCCAFLKKRVYTFRYEDSNYLFNRQVRAKIQVKSGVVTSTLTGKIKHYRFVGGKYKKRRANMRLLVGGSAYDGSCAATNQVWSAFKGYKNRKKRAVRARIWENWREAVVCPFDTRFAANKCSLGFFLDNESHGFILDLRN